MEDQKHNRSASQTGMKPPRPFSSGRQNQTTTVVAQKDKSAVNIKRLLNTAGTGTDDDPLGNETNPATSQTELVMGKAHQSDFCEDDGNQYFVTKFKNNANGAESGRQRLRPGSGIQASANAHVTIGSEGVGRPERLAIQLEDKSRRQSEATAHVDYQNYHIGSPTEKNFLSTGQMQETPVMRIQQANSDKINNDSDTNPGGLSSISFPNADKAVLPNGISPRAAQPDDASQFTQQTQKVGMNRTSNQHQVGSLMNSQNQAQQHVSEGANRSQLDESEGQHTAVVPPVTLVPNCSSHHIKSEPLSHHASENFDAMIAGQMLTGEAQQQPEVEVVPKPVPQSVLPPDARQEAAAESASRRLLTDSQLTDEASMQQQTQPIPSAEEVKSAEFAMSTFSVLNNAPVEVMSGNDQRTTTAVAAAPVQKQHILSGQLQLKQSSSVLTNGHANETMSQQLAGEPAESLQAFAEPKKNQSRTVMEHQQHGISSAINAAATSDQRPNRPMEQHFDSVDIRPVSVQPKESEQPQISEQVVYNRLPKDYFMQAAEEQMDIDIAINDIKKLRQGFISYVNEEGAGASAPNDQIDQIDDFLDPQKFIERHFGAENPDIIFQEVIQSVPDPPAPAEEVPVEELAQVEDDGHEIFDAEDKDMKESSNAGGFTEQNVTPDLWADFSSNQPRESVPEAAARGTNNNLITGETFLKDARVMDSSINQMHAMKDTVNQLGRPYNDDEMGQQPENTNVFSTNEDYKEGEQFITVAMDSQVSEHIDSIEKKKSQLGDADVSSQMIAASSQNTKQTIENAEAADLADIDVTKRVKKKKYSPRNERRAPIKALRMADYFKPSKKQPSSLMNMSKASTAEDRATMHLSQQDMSGEDLETIQAEQKWREEMDARLERDILDNVDVNFIFNKGVGLTQGLLDPDRIYSVMNKLKELAYKQLQSGSDKINYQDIVQYLQSSEGFFAEEILTKEQRNKIYAGEHIEEQKTTNELPQSDSCLQIANEPAVVGLGDDDYEKKRRWTQCVAFLRNNPRLLLQMIPNPEDDEEELKSAVMVGRPRPLKKNKKCKLNKPLQGSQQNQEILSQDTVFTPKEGQVSAIDIDVERPVYEKRFLAASNNIRKGPACGKKSNSVFNFTKKTAMAQRPIKVRPNAVKNRSYWARKATEPYDSQMEGQSDVGARLNYTDQVINPDAIEGLSSHLDDYQRQHQSSPEIVAETNSSNNPTVNITTIVNPSNVELHDPIMSLSTPNNQVNGEKIVLDDQKERQTSETRQRTAALKNVTSQNMKHYVSKTGPVLSMTNSKVMINSHSTDLHKNTLASRIKALRIQSGKLPGQRGRSGQQMRGQRQQRGNIHSALQLEEVNNSFSQFPDNIGSSRPDTAGQFFTQKQYNWRQPTRPIVSGGKVDYSSFKNHPVSTASGQEQRPFRSNKNMMKRVFSQDSYISYNFNSNHRPSTAATGPAMQMTSLGTGRKPMASNSILQYSRQARSFNRHFLYNKMTYQNSGALANPQAVVDTHQHRPRVCNLNPISVENRTQNNEQVFDQNSVLTGVEVTQDPGQSNIYSDAMVAASVVSAQKAPMVDTASQTATDDVPTMKRNMDAQTEIMDVTNDHFNQVPITPAQDRSMQSHFGHVFGSQVDWAYTPLCVAVLKKDTTWNKEHEKRVFMENEIDVVLQMIKANFASYMQPDKLQPFHAKAMSTLKALLKEQGLDQLFQRYEQQYHEVTVENALKILLRCKLVFQARQLFIEIFEKIVMYEMMLADAKLEIESKDTYKLPLQELNEMRLKCGRMYEAGEKVLFEIKKLRADRKGQYSQPFIFKKKDLTLRIKNEISEMRQLLKVYRVKRSKDSQDSDRPARFIVVTDDEVSEREEVRDSNYIGTDLYWENRFYQVRPFKKGGKEESDGEGLEDKPRVDANKGRATITDEEIKDKEFVMI